ncbi:Uncharacterised protein [Haemophilus pittmaniae]|uniref:Uncharacterized protein n=1 Tax=Haemophilus pittmaniae TaxID=249188 RepID=A0A377IYW0_9PAST|nr:hypothetical protein [Haemophilus pittmaniae]STO93158.1 Uncharacterised protein [Haemophilus pittmaniae]
MIYVSIPVHEKPEVIVNQMQNFARYLPEAKVVLHVSKGAKFSTNELEDFLKEANTSNTLINPTQVETKWGSIIQAHLANIRYIIQQGDAEKVVFHSSNDMLIMDGLSEYLKDKKNIFHLRKCTSDSLWWVSRRAMEDSFIISFFKGYIYASQIEGSMYDIRLLECLLHNIDKQLLILENEKNYPKEEVVFSSFAYKNNINPDGLPYIYSEVHDFDRKLFRCFEINKFFANGNFFVARLFRWILSNLLTFFNNQNISIAVIESIINREYPIKQFLTLNDGSEEWIIYNKDFIFGVKRVKRDLNDLVRVFISEKYFKE